MISIPDATLRRCTRVFEIARSDSRIPGMEGLRGLAILLVFVTHCWVYFGSQWLVPGTPSFAVGDAAYLIGNTGVDLFFVLSGYLVYGGLMRRHQPFAVFLRRRIRRIYPAYLVIFAVYLIGALVVPASGKLPHSPLAALTYLAECLLLLPGIVQMAPLVSVAWSLSYEFLFYLMVPLVVSGLRLRDRSTAYRIAVIFGLIAVTVIYATVTGLHVRMVMFGAGMLVWELRPLTGRKCSCALEVFAVLGTLLAWAAAVKLRGSWGPTGTAYRADILQAFALFGGYFLLVRAAIAAGAVARFMSWAPLRWLGNISFSFYLIHTVALRLCGRVFSLPPLSHLDRGVEFLIAMPLMFVCATAFALVLYLVVERPFSLAPASVRRGPAPGARLATSDSAIGP